MAKSMGTPGHHSFISLLDILFWNHGQLYGVGPSFVAITAYTVLRRLSTRFLSVSVEVCAHSIKRAYLRSGSDDRQEGQACNPHSSSSQSICNEVEVTCQSLTINLSKVTCQTMSFMDFALFTWALSCWTGKGIPQTLGTKLKTYNVNYF